MSDSRNRRNLRETEEGITDHKRLVAAKRALNRKYEEYEPDEEDYDPRYEAVIKHFMKRF